jgi:hypothetical protein
MRHLKAAGVPEETRYAPPDFLTLFYPRFSDSCKPDTYEILIN